MGSQELRVLYIVFFILFGWVGSVCAADGINFSGENRKNPGHDTLIKMDVDARNKKLSDTVRKTGRVCPKGLKTFFQGFDSSSKAYWNVRCRRADYLLLFPRKMGEGITIVNCDVVEKAGYPCWSRNDQLTY